jgi:uncharacterized protein
MQRTADGRVAAARPVSPLVCPEQREGAQRVDDIRVLHQRSAPSEDAFTLVYTHCEIVWAIAEQLLTDDLDADLVRAGCLLHDVGVYRLGEGDDYIRHGVLGYELARDAGIEETLARFCSHHTGVGISREDVLRQRLPLPAGDYLAQTPEELLVMYADKFHSKTTPPTFVSADRYAATVRRFGADKEQRFEAMRRKFGEPDLEPLSRRYGHPVMR